MIIIPGQHLKTIGSDSSIFTDATKPTPKQYGTGPIWIDGVQYYSDGADFIRVNNNLAQNSVAILGDSFDTRSIETTGSFNPYALWQLINMLMGQRMDFVNIDAVNGSGAIETPTYISRIQAGVYDYKPKYCAVRPSINDVANVSNTLSDLITAYTTLFKDINDNGIKIIANTVAPSDLYTTTALAGKWVKFNEWLLQTAPNLFDILVLNQHYQNADKSSLLGGADNSLTDGTHPDLNGAMNIALDSATQLLPIFPIAGVIDSLSAVGIGDSTAIDLNPINIGTSGTLFNGSNTGTVANSMQGAALNGTAVWSKVARTDGPGEWQQVVWTPTSANQICQYAIPFASRNQPLNAGVVIGDEVSVMLEVEYDSATSAADVYYPAIVLEFVGSGVIISGNIFNTSMVAMDKTGWRGTIKTPKAKIPAGTTDLKIEYKIFNKTTGVQTVRFGRHGLINYDR